MLRPAKRGRPGGQLMPGGQPGRGTLLPPRPACPPYRLACEPRAEQLLTQLGALTAVGLGLAEELRELRVTAPLGILGKGLQPQCVVQAVLGLPDDVVVLAGRAGDPAGLACAHCFLLVPC